MPLYLSCMCRLSLAWFGLTQLGHLGRSVGLYHMPAASSRRFHKNRRSRWLVKQTGQTAKVNGEKTVIL